MSDDIYVNTDGGAENNPGPAGSAFIVREGDRIVCVHAEYIGNATNNAAEYTALIKALEYVREGFPKKKIVVRSDSQLMVRQMNGEYAVKSKDLRPLYEKAREFASGMDVTIEWVGREKNKDADFLVSMVRRGRNG